MTVLTSGVWGIIWIVYLSMKLETSNAITLSSGNYTVARIVGRGSAFLFIPIFLIAQCFAIPEKLGTKRAYIGMKPRTNWLLGLLPVIALISFIFYYFAGDVFFRLSRERYWEIFNIMLIILFASELIWIFVIQYFLKDFESEREMKHEERAEKSRLNRERRKSNKPLPYMTGPYHKNEELPPLELSGFESISDDESDTEGDNNIENNDDYWNDYESSFKDETGEIDEN